MELQTALSTRRSVRNYLPQPVSENQVRQLLAAAAKAPSAMNSQPWAFAVIQDVHMLKNLSDRAKRFLLSILKDLPAMEKYRGTMMNSEFNIFYNASTLIAIYAKPADGPHAAEDCCLAAQNLMLTAHDMGLGSCWIGFARPLLDQDEVKKELGIPLEYAAVAPLIVGFPAGETMEIPRKEPEILFWKKPAGQDV